MAFFNYIGSAMGNTALFLLAALLPWLAVAFVMQLFSNSIRKSLVKLLGIQGYIYLTCPGVMVHEIGHALFCVIFRHKIVEMKLFSPEDDGTLGYVNHSYNPKSFYQRIGNFFIGTGPIWFGGAVLCLISWLFLPEEMQIENSVSSVIGNFFSADFWSRWQSYVWLYLMLTVASHITLSPPDLAGSVDGGIAISVTSFLSFLLFGWCGEWENSVIEFFKDLFFSSCGIFSFVFILLLMFSIVCKLISRK